MKNNCRILQNDRGFSMIEIMIAGVLGVLVLGVTIYVFNKQEDVITTQNTSTNIRAKGRHAIKVLAQELKEIGFGLPPNEGFVAPDPVPILQRLLTAPICLICALLHRQVQRMEEALMIQTSM